MKELDVVRLTQEFEGLPIGTEGTIVCEYDGKAFEVEFFDSEGDTIDVFTTPVEVLELLYNTNKKAPRNYANSLLVQAICQSTPLNLFVYCNIIFEKNQVHF